MAAPLEDIRAIKPFLGPGPDWGPLLVALLLALLVAGVLVYLRRHPRRAAPEAVTPGATALTLPARLEALRRSGLAEAGEAAAFCEQLAEIVRELVTQRYGISSKRLTSTELLAELERQGVGSLVREPLETVLAGLDLVKFAKVRLPAAELLALLATAKLLLELEPRGGTP